PFDSPGQLGAVKLCVAIAVAYFIAARLSLGLRANPEGLAIFWPAGGIAVGAMVALGPRARWPALAGIVLATLASNLMIGRNVWLAAAFGFVNAGHALCTTWLIGYWFGSAIKLDDVRQVLGFLVASAIGAVFAACAAAIAVRTFQTAAPTLNAWRVWFAAC